MSEAVVFAFLRKWLWGSKKPTLSSRLKWLPDMDSNHRPKIVKSFTVNAASGRRFTVV